MKTLALLLLLAGTAQAQSLEKRIAAAPDGSVRFSFSARPGVFGNGRNSISWGCDQGNCRHRQVDDNWDSDDHDWDAPCDSGPVRVALRKSSGRTSGSLLHPPGVTRSNGT